MSDDPVDALIPLPIDATAPRPAGSSVSDLVRRLVAAWRRWANGDEPVRAATKYEGTVPAPDHPDAEPAPSEPPVSELLMSEPPVSEPPVSEPPAPEPPLPEPPVAEAPASEPPVAEGGPLRDLVSAMRDAFFVGEVERDAPGGRSVDFRFVEVNPAFETLTGITPAAAIGHTIRDLIPDIQPGMIEVCGHVAATGQSVDFEIGIPSLGNRWYEARAFSTQGDGRFGMVLRETTAARRVDAQFRDTEARLQLMQDAAGVGTWDWDLATGRMRWSRWMYVLWGRPAPRASLGEIPSDTMFAAIDADDRERVVAELRQTTTLGAPFRSEFRIVTPAGDVRRLVGRARIVSPDSVYAGGRLMGVVVDLTDVRHAVEDRSRLAAELEVTLHELAGAREALRSRLIRAERTEVVGRLAAGIAHDFNNVLQATQGVLDLIQRRAADPDQVRRYAGLGLDAARRGASATRRVLALARPADTAASGTGESGAGASEFDVAALLGDVRETLIHALGSAVTVRLSLSAAVAPVAADRSRLETVLMHLAIRARDAMPAGGSVTFAALPELVAAAPQSTAGQDTAEDGPPAGLAPGAYVRIAVIDTGSGLDAATLARAAEPHLAAASGDDDALALALARAFAEEAGGALQVESTRKQGSVVSLYLPSAPTAARTAT